MPRISRAKNAAGRQLRFHTDSAIATTAATPAPTGVSPSNVPASASVVSVGVRWSANHRDTSLSHGSTPERSGPVISQPMARTAPRITAQATSTIAEVESQPRLEGLPLRRAGVSTVRDEVVGLGVMPRSVPRRASDESLSAPRSRFASTTRPRPAQEDPWHPGSTPT